MGNPSASRRQLYSLALAGGSLLFISFALFYKIFDYDFWIHLTGGRYNLNNGTILAHDVFTFSQYGVYWCNHEWLYQLLLYTAYLLVGFSGIVILNALFCALIIYLFYKNLEVDSLWTAVLAWVLLLLAFSGCLERLNVRPHVFSLFFTASYLYILRQYLAGKIKQPYHLLLLQVFWVNLHGGTAPLGYFYTAAFLGEALFRYFTSQQENQAAMLVKVKFLAWCLLGLILVSLLNPYTYHILTYPFEKAGQSYQVSHLQEWQSLSWPVITLGMIVLTLLVLAALPRLLQEKQLALPALTLVFAFLTYRHIRFRSEFLLLAVWPAHFYLRRRRWGGKWQRLALHLLLGALLTGALSYDVLINVRQNTAQGFGVDWEKFPTGVAAFIQKNLPGRKIINPYAWGGFLTWNLPDNLIFIDGRQLPGEKVFREYDAIYGDATLVQPEALMAILQQYDADVIFYAARDYPLAAASQLFAPNLWSLIYFDRQGALFVPRLPKYASLRARFAYQLLTPWDSTRSYYQKALADKAIAPVIERELQRAVTDDPLNRTALLPLANYYLHQRRWADAIHPLRQLAALDPGSLSVREKLDLALRSQAPPGNAP